MRKNLEDLEIPGPAEMQALIESLTPAERASLSDPNFITEDEADLILSDRSEHESSERFVHVPTGRRRQRLSA